MDGVEVETVNDVGFTVKGKLKFSDKFVTSTRCRLVKDLGV